MTREFSSDSREWLNNYHGSIDSTALLLAFDAGVASLTAQLQAAQAAIEKHNDGLIADCYPIEVDTSALAAVKAGVLREAEKALGAEGWFSPGIEALRASIEQEGAE